MYGENITKMSNPKQPNALKQVLLDTQISSDIINHVLLPYVSTITTSNGAKHFGEISSDFLGNINDLHSLLETLATDNSLSIECEDRLDYEYTGNTNDDTWKVRSKDEDWGGLERNAIAILQLLHKFNEEHGNNSRYSLYIDYSLSDSILVSFKICFDHNIPVHLVSTKEYDTLRTSIFKASENTTHDEMCCEFLPTTYPYRVLLSEYYNQGGDSAYNLYIEMSPDHPLLQL
jgi:hypothetical protein